MIQVTPKFVNHFILDLKSNSSKLPFSTRKFDCVLILPQDIEIDSMGRILKECFEIKTKYNPNLSFLLISTTANKAQDKLSPAALFGNYFLSTEEFKNLSDFYLLEISFNDKYINWSDKIQKIFNLISVLDFDCGTFISFEKDKIPDAKKINVLIESAKNTSCDLTIGAYSIPFFKGIGINYWMMPIAYLFGRSIRNPASPDFVFTKRAMSYWQNIEWPEIESISNCFFFMTISFIPSGFSIKESFMGNKNIEEFHDRDSNVEMLLIGLFLVEKYKRFIQNSSKLISINVDMNPSILFNIYSIADLENHTVFYDKNGNYFAKKYNYLKFLIKKFGNKNIMEKFEKYVSIDKEDYNYEAIWSNLMMVFFSLYFETSTQKRKKEIVHLLDELFSIKHVLWATEIRKIIKNARNQMIQDEKRGYPWIGGDEGFTWHIHDQYEKRLQNEWKKMFETKTLAL